MRYSVLTLILASVFILNACTTLTIAGMVGSTVARTIERENAEPKLDKDEIAAANINLGIEYMRQENYEKAQEKLESARQANPGYAPVYNALGLLYQRLEKPRDAERSFKKSIRLDTGDSNSLNNYAQFLCRQERESAAEKYFLRAANNPLYDTPEIPYTNAGTCAFLHEQTDKAIDYFTRALSINPRIPAALIQMAEINYAGGNYLAAHDYLNRYQELVRHSAGSLWLGIRIENELDNKNTVSSYALLLRNNFSGTQEAELLQKSGIR